MMVKSISPTLLIMAAGMGSRYGGLKQIDPVGPSGELVIDYSIFDALKAGFGKIVFIIRKDIEEVFRQTIGGRFESKADVRYVFQELSKIPKPFNIPEGRSKPWGTGQAILMARDEIQEPFAVINADDFYGAQSFATLGGFLKTPQPSGIPEYSLVGFYLKNTISEHGSVSRGVCEADSSGYVKKITERTKIERKGSDIVYVENEKSHPLSADTLVSMNMFGFDPSLFGFLERDFVQFLDKQGRELKSEFYIPSEVDQLISRGEVRVKVLPTSDKWFGVTYVEDKPAVTAGIKKLIEQGVYPERLFLSTSP
jgi:UTP-glucose-1-phosphate uridylyltransferase